MAKPETHWLPASAFELDQRPHLEILGEKYLGAHANSEVEFCIPIRRKSEV